MIVERLQADNLLRYRNLCLADLPARGVIGISGDNETGKSAIGEILCFALFGRTYALEPNALAPLVRWGAGRGSVVLTFSANDQRYEVSRQIDSDGVQSARLSRAGSAGEPLVRGTAVVDEHIRRLLGYGFEEYLETFYLAQREITTPHAHSPAVRRMSGVAPLLRCAQDLSAEAAAGRTAAQATDERVAALSKERARLAAAHPPAEEVERELTGTEQGARAAGEVLDGLTRAAKAYADAGIGKRADGVRRGIAGLLSALTLLAALAVGGVWAMLRFRPELWPMPAVRRGLEGAATASGLSLEALLLYTAIALVGVLVLVWLWRLTLDLGARRRLARARRLAHWLQRADELEIGPGVAPPPVPDLLEGGEVSLDGHLLLDRPDSERRSRLSQRVLSLAATPQEVRLALAHERAWIQRLQTALTVRRASLAATLEQARDARESLRALNGELGDVRARLDELQGQTATESLAAELLQGAAQSRSERFADQVRAGVARVLPLLTGGAYEHLQLDVDLGVRVYSSAKRGFLAPAEISTGTHRQVMLALRLALADQLATRVLRDRQFAFLDEPFAFFDEMRMAGALAALPQAGEGVVQHWVVAQRFPAEAGLALEVRCGAHPDTLELPAAVAVDAG